MTPTGPIPSYNDPEPEFGMPISMMLHRRENELLPIMRSLRYHKLLWIVERIDMNNVRSYEILACRELVRRDRAHLEALSGKERRTT